MNERRSALITGAARGIGLSIAQRLHDDGHLVALFDRDAAALQLAAQQLHGALSIAGDVRSDHDMRQAFTAVRTSHGAVQILVNNAGTPGRTGPIEEQRDEDWELQLDTILSAYFRWSREAVPDMKSLGWGRLIYVASVAGKEGNPNRIPYSVVEAGVLCLAKALGKELAASGILVNAIAAAVVDTDLLQEIPSELLNQLLAKIPLGRPGRPAEVAAAVSFLVRDGTFTTGQTLDLSGGRSTY